MNDNHKSQNDKNWQEVKNQRLTMDQIIEKQKSRKVFSPPERRFKPVRKMGWEEFSKNRH